MNEGTRVYGVISWDRYDRRPIIGVWTGEYQFGFGRVYFKDGIPLNDVIGNQCSDYLYRYALEKDIQIGNARYWYTLDKEAAIKRWNYEADITETVIQERIDSFYRNIARCKEELDDIKTHRTNLDTIMEENDGRIP